MLSSGRPRGDAPPPATARARAARARRFRVLPDWELRTGATRAGADDRIGSRMDEASHERNLYM